MFQKQVTVDRFCVLFSLKFQMLLIAKLVDTSLVLF